MKVRIEMTGQCRGKVWIDDVQVKVRRIEFRAALGEVNTVTLEMIPDQVEISGPAEVIADQTSILSQHREHARV